MNKYESKALEYAEKHGIRDYKVKGNQMVYYEKYPTEGTYKCTVDFDKKTEYRKHLYQRKH